MANETVKIRSGSGFNEGGGTVFSTVTGEATDLTNPALNRLALPADENRYGITEYVTISVGAATGEVAPAVAGRQIMVVSYVFVADAATTVTFKSATTAISGAMTLDANGGVAVSESSDGLMWTEPGEALNITNSAGNINGHLTYRIV
jgi:hypothetical protein